MSNSNLQNTELTKAIELAIESAASISKERLKAKRSKNKNRKEHGDRKASQNSKVNALDSLVEDLMQMKEGERKAQLIRPIVPIEEWLGNEYYCGQEVFNLYPFWKEHMIKIYNSPVMINEIILTGGLGTGKTTFANAVILRKIYELSCYMNVPALFNLLPTSLMLFAYFNLNLAQANLTGYGQLRNMIDSSKYFREQFPRNTRTNSAIEFTKANMMVRFASNEGHIIGTNLFGSILDEANFYKGDGNVDTSKVGEAQSQAKKIYTAIRNRRKIPFYCRWRKSFTIYISFIYNV